MKPPDRLGRRRHRRARGSVLLTAMLIAIAVGAGLIGYLKLSYTSLKLSQRTFYANCAANLSEAGLEQAVLCYRQLAAGTAAATAWAGWTLSGGNATLTLPTFNCSGQAVGVVEVFVSGYAGTGATAAVYAQAVVTPLDGSPAITKTLKVVLNGQGSYKAAIATWSSLLLGSSSIVDSFNSNPKTVNGQIQWTPYSSGIAGSAGNLVASAGTISLGTSSLVKGDVYLGAGVTAPSQSQVTGTIYPNASASYPTPGLPSWTGGTGYYALTTMPDTLPRDNDKKAPDGRYYYYPATLLTSLVVSNTNINSGSNVTLCVSQINGQLRVGSDSSCIVWCGNVTTNGSNGLQNYNSNNWSGALQIYSWGTSVSLTQNFNFAAYIYAPLAAVSFGGSGSSKQFYGAIVARSFNCTSGWLFHYDRALESLTTQAGAGYSVSKWYDLQGTAESKTLATLTGGFLN
jgi:hypothetical protein